MEDFLSKHIKNLLFEIFNEAKKDVDTENKPESSTEDSVYISEKERKKLSFEEYLGMTIEQERKVLPFTMKYAMVGGTSSTFEKEMTRLFFALDDRNLNSEQIVELLFPQLKGKTKDVFYFKDFLDIVKTYKNEEGNKSSYFDKPEKEREDLPQIYSKEDFKNKKDKFLNTFKNEMGKGERKISFLAFSDSLKLTPTGFAQLQFCARLATNQIDDILRPEETIFKISPYKQAYRERALKIIIDFYKKAIIPIASRISGRNLNNKEMQSFMVDNDFDPEFNNLVFAGIDKLLDNIVKCEGGKSEICYDASTNNFGAWAFTVIKNGIIDALKKYTSMKFHAGYDKKTMRSISDWFLYDTERQYSTWISKMDYNTALQSGILPEDLAYIPHAVDSSGNSIPKDYPEKDTFYLYKFKDGQTAYSYFLDAMQTNTPSIFNSLSKVSLNKLKVIGAYKSTKRDVDYNYLNPTEEEPENLDIKPGEEYQIYSVDTDTKQKLYKELAETIITNIDPENPSASKKPGLDVFRSPNAEIYSKIIENARANGLSNEEIQNAYKSSIGEALFSLWTEPIYHGPVWISKPSKDFLSKLEELYNLPKGTLIEHLSKIKTSSSVYTRPVIVQDDFYIEDSSGKKVLMPELDKLSYENVPAAWAMIPSDEYLQNLEKKYNRVGKMIPAIEKARTQRQEKRFPIIIDDIFYVIKDGEKDVIQELRKYALKSEKPLIKYATSQREGLVVQLIEAMRKYNSDQIIKMKEGKLGFLFDAEQLYPEAAREYGSKKMFDSLKTVVGGMRHKAGGYEEMKSGSIINPANKQKTLDKISKIISLLSGTDVYLKEELKEIVEKLILEMYKK